MNMIPALVPRDRTHFDVGLVAALGIVGLWRCFVSQRQARWRWWPRFQVLGCLVRTKWPLFKGLLIPHTISVCMYIYIYISLDMYIHIHVYVYIHIDIHVFIAIKM